MTFLQYSYFIFHMCLLLSLTLGEDIYSDGLVQELYHKYKEAVTEDKSNSSLRRLFKADRHYNIHVQKLKEVNGFKVHNLLIEEKSKNDQKGNPFIYINNPVESKVPYAYLTLEEFKSALTNRIEVQRQSLTAKIKDKKYTIKTLHKTPETKSFFLTGEKNNTNITRSKSKKRKEISALTIISNIKLHKNVKIYTLPKYKSSSQSSQVEAYNRIQKTTKYLETTMQNTTSKISTKKPLRISEIENDLVTKNVPEIIVNETPTKNNDIYFKETSTEISINKINKNDLGTKTIILKDKIKQKEVIYDDPNQNKTSVIESSLTDKVTLYYNETNNIYELFKGTEETKSSIITKSLENIDGKTESKKNASIDTEVNTSEDTDVHTWSTFTHTQRETPRRNSTTEFVTELSSITSVSTEKKTPKRKPTQEHSRRLSTVEHKRKTLGRPLVFMGGV